MIRIGPVRGAAVALAWVAGSTLASGADDRIVVAAASSLREVVEDAAAALGPEGFAVHTAGSAILARQIERGAPIAVYLSASPDDVDRLTARGLLEPGSRVAFAGNALIAVVPPGRPAPAAFEDLADPAHRRIAMANPRTSPAGRYASDALASLGIDPSDRAVYAENVRQALEYVARGDVDAGVVYASDAAAFPGRVVVGARAPAGSHAPITYVGARVASGSGRDPRAVALLEWLRSAAGRAAFERRGFAPPPTEVPE